MAKRAEVRKVFVASAPRADRSRKDLAGLLLRHGVTGHAGVMPDRPYPAVEALVRRVQRVAASRPDPAYILAQTINMAAAAGADPYAILGILIEGAVQTLAQHIPPERQAEAAATMLQLLEERLKARGVTPDGC